MNDVLSTAVATRQLDGGGLRSQSRSATVTPLVMGLQYSTSTRAGRQVTSCGRLTTATASGSCIGALSKPRPGYAARRSS